MSASGNLLATERGSASPRLGLWFGTSTTASTSAAPKRVKLTACIEADWRLFTTLVRFDSVYVGHFKCNLRRIVDYPNLWDFTRELYQRPGVAGTTDFTHIKHHYYQSHTSINPMRIVPIGPELDFPRPHGRADVPRRTAVH
jgi:putative glutathione S-transferase